MLKAPSTLNEIGVLAAREIENLLGKLPFIQKPQVKRSKPNSNYDILAEFTVRGRLCRLAVEVKGVGQPRHVREALLRLRKAADALEPPALPVFVAPYLSREAQALCREFDVGYLDLVGNTWIAFDTVFIERQVDAKPPVVQRRLKSIFKPKSAQVLRVLLRNPKLSWRVADLSDASGVSLGHVSNVRSELVDREWAEITEDGLRLSHPDALLDAWRDVYEPPVGERISFYTTNHGKALDNSMRTVLSVDPNAPKAVLASFSAAHWLAPYGRVGIHYLYADAIGLVALRDALGLSPAGSGANVLVTVPKDEGLFKDVREPVPGVVCTGPVQTYLDLSAAGERGVEAAEHLRGTLLSWPK